MLMHNKDPHILFGCQIAPPWGHFFTSEACTETRQGPKIMGCLLTLDLYLHLGLVKAEGTYLLVMSSGDELLRYSFIVIDLWNLPSGLQWHWRQIWHLLLTCKWNPFSKNFKIPWKVKTEIVQTWIVAKLKWLSNIGALPSHLQIYR